MVAIMLVIVLPTYTMNVQQRDAKKCLLCLDKIVQAEKAGELTDKPLKLLGRGVFNQVPRCPLDGRDYELRLNIVDDGVTISCPNASKHERWNDTLKGRFTRSVQPTTSIKPINWYRLDGTINWEAEKEQLHIPTDTIVIHDTGGPSGMTWQQLSDITR